MSHPHNNAVEAFGTLHVERSGTRLTVQAEGDRIFVKAPKLRDLLRCKRVIDDAAAFVPQAARSIASPVPASRSNGANRRLPRVFVVCGSDTIAENHPDRPGAFVVRWRGVIKAIVHGRL